MEITIQSTPEQDAAVALLAGEEAPLEYLTKRILSYLVNVCQEAEGLEKQAVQEKFAALSLVEQKALVEKPLEKELLVEVVK